jgi:hypothetical protein
VTQKVTEVFLEEDKEENSPQIATEGHRSFSGRRQRG